MKTQLLFIVFAIAAMLGGTQKAHAQVQIFRNPSVSPYTVPADTPTSIRLKAEHYGRPIMNIPCAYNFYVVDYTTKQTIPSEEGYNQKPITIPSNGGYLNEDFEVKLPEGRYYIYYVWIYSLGEQGPFSFSPIIVGNPPPLPQSLAISNFAITETWQSIVDGSERSYLKQKGSVSNSSSTINTNMRYWHSNLADAEVTVELNGWGKLSVNGDEAVEGTAFTFNADFTQPVILTITTTDGTNTVNGTTTMSYTVTVNNATGGNRATPDSGISFNWDNAVTGEPQSVEATLDYTGNTYILTISPEKLASIGEDGFSCFISLSSSINASVTLDDQQLDCVLRYFNGIYGQYGYWGELSGIDPADAPYTFTVTSADGTVTNEYTIQMVVKNDPVNFWNEEYCGGFYYHYSQYGEPIIDPIPLDFLQYIYIPLNLQLPEGRNIEYGTLSLRQEEWLDNQILSISFEDEWRMLDLWQANVNDISPGRYEVVLSLVFSLEEEEEEELFFEYQDYILGDIMLVDEATYSVNIASFDNGRVSSGRSIYMAGEEVSLSLWNITTGYELASIEVYKTGDESTKITLNGTGNGNYASRTFTMPEYDVTVVAVFRNTQLSDEEAIDRVAEVIESSIENGTFEVRQSASGSAGELTEATLKDWLVDVFNSLLGTIIQFRSTDNLTGEIEVTAFTAAKAGTRQNPKGTDGSFSFEVTLKRGEAILSTIESTGVITALAYTDPPAPTLVKRIGLRMLDSLTFHIENTGNVETGSLTLTLSGEDADAFTLPTTTVGSLPVGGSTDITLIFRSELPVDGPYKATLTVSGNELTAVSIAISYAETTTGITNPQVENLAAYMQNEILHITGLTIGQDWSIYNISGILVYNGTADSNEANITLPVRGVYIIISGNQVLKTRY